jgi:hypothetical protein
MEPLDAEMPDDATYIEGWKLRVATAAYVYLSRYYCLQPIQAIQALCQYLSRKLGGFHRSYCTSCYCKRFGEF